MLSCLKKAKNKMLPLPPKKHTDTKNMVGRFRSLKWQAQLWDSGLQKYHPRWRCSTAPLVKIRLSHKERFKRTEENVKVFLREDGRAYAVRPSCLRREGRHVLWKSQFHCSLFYIFTHFHTFSHSNFQTFVKTCIFLKKMFKIKELSKLSTNM